MYQNVAHRGFIFEGGYNLKGSPQGLFKPNKNKIVYFQRATEKFK